MFRKVLILLCLVILSLEAVKIGISKPVSSNETTTTAYIETTTAEVLLTTTINSTTTFKPTKPNTQTANTTKVKSTSTTPLPSTSTVSTTTETTPSTSTTTSETPNNNVRRSSNRNKNSGHSGYFCDCDLRQYVCEINCCCDIDCMDEELKVFNCQRKATHLDNVLYQPGLPPCNTNDGWLCVFRNNYEDTRKKRTDYVPDLTTINKWPQLLLEFDDASREQSFYKFGDPILLYNSELNDVIEYDIPLSIIDQNCNVFDSIRHLSPRKISCLSTLEHAQSLENSLFSKLGSSYILQRPNVKMPLDDTIRDELIPIAIYRCSSGSECYLASNNNSLFESLDDIEYSSTIQTKIFHNITDILACEVFFIRSSPRTYDYWQHYHVNFIHVNQTDDIPLNVSGALGYDSGKPLIVAQKVLLNESSLDHDESNLVLSYFHPTRSYPIHIQTPRRRSNRCELNNSTVNFGESLLSQCTIQLDNSTELNSDSNFTKICGDLQEKMYLYLQLNEVLELQDDFFLSSLGYPKNDSNEWIKIEVRNYDYLPIIGTYLGREYAFICQNMILDVTYELITIHADVRGVLHQNIVKRVVLDVGRRHDLQFEMDEVISIPVTFSVVFQDIHEISGATILSNHSFRMILFSLLLLVSEMVGFC